MKYAIYPHVWEEATAVIDVAGHERVELAEADFLLFNGEPYEFPDQLPDSLAFVQLPFAGVDHMLEVIAQHEQVRFSHARGLYDSTVAESTVGLMLAVGHAHKRMALAQSWSAHDAAEAETRFLDEDCTVAIIGAGGIGARLIELLQPFGVRIIAVNRSGREVAGASETVAIDQVDQVWPRADIVVIIAPLTPETRGMINSEVFAALPSHATVINVGRGPVVVTEDLVAALAAGEIAGAGLDVTDPEPLPDGHPLWSHPRVIITPHLANPPYSVRRRIGAHTVAVAAHWADTGELLSEVNRQQGY